MSQKRIQTFKKLACSVTPYLLGTAAIVAAGLPASAPISQGLSPLMAGQGTADIPADWEWDQHFPKFQQQDPQALPTDRGLTIALNRLLEKRAIREAAQQKLSETNARDQVIREPVLREIIEKRSAREAELKEHLAKEEAARQAVLQESIEERSSREAAHPTGMPIQRAGISAEFGTRWNPFGKGTDFHEGIDLVGPFGAPIYATAAGVVKRARSGRSNGNYVVIDHGNGYKTLYAHLSRYVVKRRLEVKRGQLIGFMGSTGRSTGPHLHYGIYKKGKPINPYGYMYGHERPTIAQVSYICGRLVPQHLQSFAARTALSQNCHQSQPQRSAIPVSAQPSR